MDMSTQEKFKKLTKMEDGSLKVEFESGKVSILPLKDPDWSVQYNNETIQAAPYFCHREQSQ